MPKITEVDTATITDEIMMKHSEKLKNVYDTLKDISKTRDNLLLSFSRFQILGDLTNNKSGEWKTSIESILKKVDEINSKIFDIGNLDTNYTRKYIAVQMLNPAGSTYRILKQILAQIESLQRALKDHIRSIKLVNLDIKEMFLKLQDINRDSTVHYKEIEREKLILKIEQKLDVLSDLVMKFNITVNDLKLYVDLYEQVKKNKNIPDTWTKEDLEVEEYKHHVRNAFRLAIRDVISSTRLSQSTCEYLENIGISPIKAINLIKEFVSDNRSQDIRYYYEFLDTVAEIFKDNIKLVDMKIGYDHSENSE